MMTLILNRSTSFHFQHLVQKICTNLLAKMLHPDQNCILYQERFISAYSHTALMPLWSTFTIGKSAPLLIGRSG